MPKTTAIARFTGNNQLSIPKSVREAVGLSLGDFVELTAERGTIVLRPKQLTNKPIPTAAATAAERRAIERGRAESAAGESIAYEQYKAGRASRLEHQPRQKRTKTAR